jgi:protein-L-isoaspartate O-methyltransferase
MNKSTEAYVHGYRSNEKRRLTHQATTLAELLHCDTEFPDGSTVLEVGCGTGAQTIILAARNPRTRFTSMDINADSIAQAERKVVQAGLTNVEFRQANLFESPFEADSFDHVFVCFVLEHLAEPAEGLALMTGLLKRGGTMTVIEGDHGSTYFHPDSAAAEAVVKCQVTLQRNLGGNALIGRQLYPLMTTAGLEQVRVSPRMVYVDSSRPELVDGFTRKTFIAMIEGVRESASQAGLTTLADFDAGVRDLYRTTETDGVFCYTFFKGTGQKEK